ncbi:ATP-binding protein [Phenylobacterium sp.]|jgi:signal transduction histidine kinase/ActR/RegA family two-component response regulator|uniref:ATP-binding protein n=1 Tax=Phenylobacterium sp. TaxID=1871053 RepID=UPI002F402DCE
MSDSPCTARAPVHAGSPRGLVHRQAVGAASLILGAFVSPLSAMAAASVILSAGAVNASEFALRGVAAYSVIGLAILAILAALSSMLIGLARRRRAFDQFREAVDVMPEGLSIWDENDRLLAWNDRVADAAEINTSMLRVGMPAGEYLRIVAASDCAIEPGDLDAWVRDRRTARRKPNAEFERRTRSGRWFRIENRRTARGGLVTVSVDITDFKRNAEILVQAREEAEAANKAKSEFLANMSHEIRTPLTSILGFAGLLENIDGLPTKANTYVNRIKTGGQALLSLVNDILECSRLEAGKVELAPKAFDLAAFIDDTVGLISTGARNKGLTFKLAAADELPQTVTADMDRLRQVLLNLLSNAVKFTESGSVTLAVSRQAEGGERIRFEVIDTGAGISPEDAARLFQRFSQVDGSNTREHGGAGLGLVISKGLVEAMGGEIGVDSAEGRGSTFWFTVEAPAASQSGPATTTEIEEWRLAPLRILMADDVAVNRELVAAMLSPFDVQLSLANNGQEAVDTALDAVFNLILMDLQMPGMDGLAATREIRKRSDLNRTTPILALSASVMPSEVAACRQAGMNDHVAKPIDPSELLSKIALWARASS